MPCPGPSSTRSRVTQAHVRGVGSSSSSSSGSSRPPIAPRCLRHRRARPQVPHCGPFMRQSGQSAPGTALCPAGSWRTREAGACLRRCLGAAGSACMPPRLPVFCPDIRPPRPSQSICFGPRAVLAHCGTFCRLRSRHAILLDIYPRTNHTCWTRSSGSST